MILEILVERTQTTTLLLEVNDRSEVNMEAVKKGVKDSIEDYEWDEYSIDNYTILGEANPEDATLYKVAVKA